MDQGSKEEIIVMRSFGLIPVKKNNDIYQILLLKHTNGGHWSFCKGGPEEGEEELETSERELNEETNLKVKKWLKGKDGELICGIMNYFVGKREIPKMVKLFVGEVEGEVKTQESEISESRWLDMDDVESLITFDDEKKLWRELKDQIFW